MARLETYSSPGALPDVRPGTLVDDLSRRDFSVNAIAYRLSGDNAGAIVDPCGGCADLDAGVLRVLHPESFVDDPSRLVRLARYAARLAFIIQPETTAAAHRVAPDLDPAIPRVGEELRRLLHESTVVPALQLLRALGVAWIRPCVNAGATTFDAVDQALATPGAPSVERWAIRLGLVCDPDRLDTVAVDGWARGVAQEVNDADTLVEALENATGRSEIDTLLRRARPATAVVAHALGAHMIRDWWATDRDLRLAIGGGDLVASGVVPGPRLGRALMATRRAVLDGALGSSREEQLAFALAEVTRP